MCRLGGWLGDAGGGITHATSRLEFNDDNVRHAIADAHANPVEPSAHISIEDWHLSPHGPDPSDPKCRQSIDGQCIAFGASRNAARFNSLLKTQIGDAAH
jgi:hypothetical protein